MGDLGLQRACCDHLHGMQHEHAKVGGGDRHCANGYASAASAPTCQLMHLCLFVCPITTYLFLLHYCYSSLEQQHLYKTIKS